MSVGFPDWQADITRAGVQLIEAYTLTGLTGGPTIITDLDTPSWDTITLFFAPSGADFAFRVRWDNWVPDPGYNFFNATYHVADGQTFATIVPCLGNHLQMYYTVGAGSPGDFTGAVAGNRAGGPRQLGVDSLPLISQNAVAIAAGAQSNFTLDRPYFGRARLLVDSPASPYSVLLQSRPSSTATFTTDVTLGSGLTGPQSFEVSLGTRIYRVAVVNDDLQSKNFNVWMEQFRYFEF